MSELEPIDRRMLDELQRRLPLAAEPFDELAGRLGLDVDELLDRLRRLKAQGIVRQIGAIFDTGALGYASCLVAAQVDPARADAAAEIINRHPGVTHNYLRDHQYNLWFTLAAPPASRLGLERTAAILRAESGAAAVRLLPAIRTFKIGVRLDLSETGQPDEQDPLGAAAFPSAEAGAPAARASAPAPLSERDIELIRVLQDDLPIRRRPFDEWAGRLGLTVDPLLAGATRLLSERRMRRFAAVLNHRPAGFVANLMAAWEAPSGRVELAGRLMSGFKAVSHCYLRATWPDWPYNLFTMIHGRQRADCQAVVEAIRRATGIEHVVALWSLREYKKARLRYFTGQIEAWEAEHGATGG